MEFRCRLGTETGEVLEEVHVSESASKLRHELEGKGFYILSLTRRGFLRGTSLTFRSRRRIKVREFLVLPETFREEICAELDYKHAANVLGNADGWKSMVSVGASCRT